MSMLAPRKFRTPQARRRQRLQLTLYGAACVAVIALIVACFAWAVTQPFARVNAVTIEGVSSISEDAVRATLTAALETRRMAFIPGDSVLVVRPEALRRTIAAEFPRAQSVTVTRAGLRSIVVRIEERTPAALWCGDVVPPVVTSLVGAQSVEAWGTCYLMDASSFIFARAPIFTGDVLPRYYGPLTKSEPVGQPFLDEEEFSAWAKLRHELNELGYPLVAMLIVDEREVEAYLENGTKVLFGRDLAPERAVQSLGALTEKGLLSTDRALEYIDLRWNEKVYYKAVEEPSGAGGEGE